MADTKQILQAFIKLAESKQISTDVAIINFKNALIKTLNEFDPDRKIDVNIVLEKNTMDFFEIYTVIEDGNEEYDDILEIPLSEAQKIDHEAELGKEIKKPLEINTWWSDRRFQDKLNKNLRNLNNIERNKKVFDKYKNEKGKIVLKRVETYSPTSGGIIEYDNEIKGEIIPDNAIPRERLIPGKEYAFYVKDVIEQPREWPIQLSRASEQLILYYLKKEVPEIADGTVEVCKIARFAGECTKIIVKSNNPNVDPISSILGLKNSRLESIQKSLNNERINIIRFYPNFNETLLSVLNSSDVVSYLVEQPKDSNDKTKITIVCPNDKQSHLIGPRGITVRICDVLLNAKTEVISVEDAQELAQEMNYEFTKADYSNIKIVQPKSMRTEGGFNKDGKPFTRSFAHGSDRQSNANNKTNNQQKKTIIRNFLTNDELAHQNQDIDKFKLNDIFNSDEEE